jgi:hypothetical protein
MNSSPNVVPQNSKRVAHDLAQRETVDPVVQDKSSVCWSHGVPSFQVFSLLSKPAACSAGPRAVVDMLKETNGSRGACSISLPCR